MGEHPIASTKYPVYFLMDSKHFSDFNDSGGAPLQTQPHSPPRIFVAEDETALRQIAGLTVFGNVATLCHMTVLKNCFKVKACSQFQLSAIGAIL
jgi:hypothetical protein